MRNLQETDSTIVPHFEDQQNVSSVSHTKRSQSDEISFPLSEDKFSNRKKKVRFQSEFNDSDYQANEDIEIANLKKLPHARCSSSKEFHIAICAGDESKIIQLLNGLNAADKTKILGNLCAEDDFAGASVLRLALRAKQLSLIGTLIQLGANPFHRSSDGNTLLHDIVLDLSYAALKILFAQTSVNDQFINFINMPFHGEIYEGYFALDIICIEATLHFKSYRQALSIVNRHIAESVFFIIQKLILNHAMSKLLTDENEKVDNYLRINKNNRYDKESIWNLIARIAELHELKTVPVLNSQPNPKIVFADMHSSVNLIAQKWGSNSLMSETKPEIPVDNNHQASLETPSSQSIPATTETDIAAQLLVLSYLPPRMS